MMQGAEYQLVCRKEDRKNTLEVSMVWACEGKRVSIVLYEISRLVLVGEYGVNMTQILEAAAHGCVTFWLRKRGQSVSSEEPFQLDAVDFVKLMTKVKNKVNPQDWICWVTVDALQKKARSMLLAAGYSEDSTG